MVGTLVENSNLVYPVRYAKVTTCGGEKERLRTHRKDEVERGRECFGIARCRKRMVDKQHIFSYIKFHFL